MLRHRTLARMQAELGALEASAERAGAALACVYSSSEEFEAAVIGTRRAAALWGPHTLLRMRLILGGATLAMLAALLALAL